MNKWLRVVITVIALLWMLTVTFLYFIDVQVSASACSHQHVNCIQFGDSNITFSWRSSHLYYPKAIEKTFYNPSFTDKQGSSTQMTPLVGIVITLFIVYIIFYLYKRFIKGDSKLIMHLSPFSFLLIFTGVFFLIAFNWFSFFNYMDAPSPYVNIFLHYITVVVQLCIVTLLCTSVGTFALHMGKSVVLHGRQFLFSFGLGGIIIVFILFLLGTIGLLSSFSAWSIIFLSCTLCYKEMWHWLKYFFHSTVSVHTGFFSPLVLLFFVLLIIIGHNVLELIRPMPIGFDDLGLYMNIPKLLSNGHLISGVNSYSWGLFMSLGFLLFKSPMSALFLSFIGGIAVILILYQLIKKYGEGRGFSEELVRLYSLLGATLFYSLPAVIFQSAKDMKVDLAAMFFALLGLMFIFHRYTEHHNISLSSTFLSALFVGFAFTMKYNILLFAPILLLLLVLVEWKKRNIRQIALICIVFFVGFVLPFLPYGIKNIIEKRDISVAAISTGKSEAPAVIMTPPIDTNIGNIQPLQLTGVKEEQGRYAGYGADLSRYLLLPFTITLNPIVSGMYVDIGFVFLAFIPIILLLYIPRRIEKEAGKHLLHITLIAGVLFWTLWALFAQGIIWYGYVGFVFLLVVIMEVLFMSRRYSHLIAWGAHMLLILWMVCSLLLRTVYLPPSIVIDNVALAYARGAIDQQGYFDRKIPYLSYINQINEDIRQHEESPPNVYRVGTFMKYFIEKNNRTVLDDNQLDVFSWIHQDNDDSKTIQRFKNSGFKYMLIDTNTPTIDKTPEQSLRKKYNTLIQFIRDNPSAIEVLLDQPKSGIMIARFL